MFLLTVASIWTIAAITPGPNFFVVARCALAGSRTVAIAAVGGTIAGTFCWGVAGWLGVGALFAAAPLAFMVMKVAGGLYLVWLGLRLILKARRPQPYLADTPAETGLTPSRAWRLGLATNLANPKTALFVASLFAAALHPGDPMTHGAAAVAVMVAISAMWYCCLALMLGHLSVAKAYRKAARTIDMIAGAAFVAFGTKLALGARS